MKRALPLLLAAALSACAFAQAENPNLRRLAQQFYRQWDQAVAKRDTKTLKSMFHPEFVAVMADGSKAGYRESTTQIDQLFAAYRDIVCTIKVDKVEGSEAELLTWATMTVRFRMKGSDGKWTETSFTEKFSETLVKTSSGYKFKFSQALP